MRRSALSSPLSALPRSQPQHLLAGVVSAAGILAVLTLVASTWVDTVARTCSAASLALMSLANSVMVWVATPIRRTIVTILTAPIIGTAIRPVSAGLS